MSRRNVQEFAVKTAAKTSLMGLSTLFMATICCAGEPYGLQGFPNLQARYNSHSNGAVFASSYTPGLPVVHSYSSYGQSNSETEAPVVPRIAPKPMPYASLTRQWNAASGFTVTSSAGRGSGQVILATAIVNTGLYYSDLGTLATGVNARRYRLQWTGLRTARLR